MYLTVLKTCHTHLSTPALRRMLAAALGTVMLLAAVPPASVSAQSRIKDIVNIEGVRDNLLVGYGLVVGLNGTGDTLQNAPFTQQSLVGMLSLSSPSPNSVINSMPLFTAPTGLIRS